MTATAQLLEGKRLAEKIQIQIRKDLDRIQKKYGCVPKLVALSCGHQDASEIYLKHQKRLAAELGLDYEHLAFEENTKQETFISAIQKLNRDPQVHGLILQMPLPQEFSLAQVISAMDPKKDVEGMHTDNLGRLVLKKEILAPCTAMAAMELIESSGVDLYGAEVVVVGSSRVVGRPIALLLMEKNATTTVCSIATSEKKMLQAHVERADVLVVAVGKPKVIPGRWIKPGSVVIDVGISKLEGKTVGDVEFEVAKDRARFITPVPGGVGPLTVTILMRNCLTAFRWQKSEIKED
jgi:methylenetetrahydrofolate dehydrogenase (NADP+)/methenyltetrahydrofolate cyclohydrolase